MRERGERLNNRCVEKGIPVPSFSPSTTECESSPVKTRRSGMKREIERGRGRKERGRGKGGERE